MVLPVAVVHKLKAILALGAVCTGLALAGCGSAVQADLPKPLPPALSVLLSSTAVSVQILQTQQFTATLQNDLQNRGVTWSLTQSGNTCTPGCGYVSGAAANQVTYTAPASVPNTATVTLTATSVADNTKSASAVISVTTPPLPVSVSLSLVAASVQTGQSQQFTATVQNDIQNRGVLWSLTQSGNACAPGCGSLTPVAATAVTFNAPTKVPNPATATLTATAVADNTKSASADISVTAPPISVSLSLATASVQTNQPQLFTATLQNDTQNQGVTWSLTQSGNACTPGCGSVSSAAANQVTYTAPSSVPSPAIVTLTATSVADTTKSDSSAITVTVPLDVFAAIVKFCDDETENPNCASKDTFSLAQIRDLFIWMNWQGVPAGTHTQELDIFMPQGHALYVKYLSSFQITTTPKGSATVMSVMPVAGTWITQRQFTGTWEVDVLLDGNLITSRQFDFTP